MIVSYSTRERYLVDGQNDFLLGRHSQNTKKMLDALNGGDFADDQTFQLEVRQVPDMAARCA